ncbi:MAG: shikimate dehydrogenase [Lachnospiraceae bacterium]|nr:shikimate dehydrogenase [Lachnospiraceae bacterium]
MRDIDGRTIITGLIGSPVEHTYSPLIQNTFAENLGVNAVYIPLGVKESLPDALKGAFAFGFAGMNVTVPYKQAVIPLLSGIDPVSERIGAVNTLVKDEEGYRGYNTDSTGFIRAMDKAGIDVRGRDCIILGAGGASRAVYDALHCSGADHVYVLNRSLDRARENFGQCSDVTLLSVRDYRSLPSGQYICIQCTPVGLYPDNDRTVIEDEAFYDLIEAGFDLVYRPARTEFMKRLERQGKKACNGLDMLLFQAAESFELFTGTKVTEEAMEAAEKALSKVL